MLGTYIPMFRNALSAHGCLKACYARVHNIPSSYHSWFNGGVIFNQVLTVESNDTLAITVTYNFIFSHHNAANLLILLNMCDLEQELWSKGKIYGKLFIADYITFTGKYDCMKI